MLLFWRRKRKICLNDDIVQLRRQRLTPMPDARMSEHSRALCVAAIVDDQPEWDYALDSEKALENALHAGTLFGFHAPFTKEQDALCNFLTRSLAGQKISVYAWGVYADICGDND